MSSHMIRIIFGRGALAAMDEYAQRNIAPSRIRMRLFIRTPRSDRRSRGQARSSFTKYRSTYQDKESDLFFPWLRFFCTRFFFGSEDSYRCGAGPNPRPPAGGVLFPRESGRKGAADPCCPLAVGNGGIGRAFSPVFLFLFQFKRICNFFGR